MTWGRHLREQILPWWESRAIDEVHGGVFTCFDNAGELISRDKYAWSQGRWAWLAAELVDEIEAGRLPGDRPVWVGRALATARFMIDHQVRADHRTVFRSRETGAAVPDADGETATSVFADLFVALGLSGAARVNPDRDEASRWLTAATDILLTAEGAIAGRRAPSEPYPVPDGFDALAWPMNLLHTAAELLRAGESADVVAVRDRAWAALVGPGGLVGTETWWEFRPLTDDRVDTLLARHRTPGHLLELLWMLDHAEVEDPAWTGDRAAALAERACAIGWDDAHGGLLRYVDVAGGEPTDPPRTDPVGTGPGEPGPSRYERLVRDTWDTKLWWVHSEAAYTLALLARRHPTLQPWADRVAEYTLATFPDRDHGEWLQIRDRGGAPLDEVVALPVKDPFHIARSLLLLNRLARTDPAP